MEGYTPQDAHQAQPPPPPPPVHPPPDHLLRPVPPKGQPPKAAASAPVLASIAEEPAREVQAVEQPLPLAGQPH
eukprot:14831662-Alexandrium_andersonii.AAC.1